MAAAHSFSLFASKSNRQYIWVAAIAVVLQFIVFKFFYPYAGFINGDSYVYLESAFWNMDINTYPVGYSRFLRIFSGFTSSDTALVGFQYLFIQCSALYFLFTVRHCYNPGRLVTNMLFIFMVFNPVFLYLSNYVSSDALFLGLSLLWFTLLLWTIHQPSVTLIVLQVIILLLAFAVRYNALFYPFVAALAILLSRSTVRVKVAGIAAGFVVIMSFTSYTSHKYYQLTGVRQFSPFSGWQMANNALLAYRHVRQKDVHDPPQQFRQLDKMVRNYFDTAYTGNRARENTYNGDTWYMWDSISPLQRYMNNRFKKDEPNAPIKRWATVAPLYANYGAYIMRHYPLQFARYYLLPNAINYYLPPVEFLETYNMGRDSVLPIAQIWFGYKSSKVKTVFKDYNVTILDWYPKLVIITNLAFLLGCIGFVIFRMVKRSDDRFNRSLLFVIGLWLANFSFSVFASPIALRFQLFPVIVFFTFSLLLAEVIYKIEQNDH